MPLLVLHTVRNITIYGLSVLIHVRVPHLHKPQNYSPICTTNKLKIEGHAISGMWYCVTGQAVPDIFFKDYDNP